MSDSIWTDHAPLMVLMATLLAAFLALLWREEARARLRFFGRLLAALLGGAIGIAWLLGRLGGR